MAWGSWVDTSNNCCVTSTNVTTAASDTIWMRWSSATTASATTATDVWVEWTTDTSTSHQSVTLRQQTEEERLEAQRDVEERQRVYAEAQERHRLEKQAAEDKALQLLKDALTQRQLEAFEKDECIPVDTAKGNRYLIKKGRSANIHVLDKSGKTTHRLCVHPKDMCPDYDTMLAQKLWFETDEDAMLRLANKHPV